MAAANSGSVGRGKTFDLGKEEKVIADCKGTIMTELETRLRTIVSDISGLREEEETANQAAQQLRDEHKLTMWIL